MSIGMKERIIKGAAKLFYKHGYSGVKVDEIAAFIGISNKTIYNHFPTKLALIEAVIDINVLAICSRLEALASDEKENQNSIDQIHHLMLFGFQEIASNEWLFTTDKKNSYAKDLIEDAFELIREKIIQMASEYLEKGMRQGLFRSDVSKDVFPYLVVIIVEGIFQLHRYSEIKIKGEELFKEAMQMLYKGILTPEGKKAFETKWA